MASSTLRARRSRMHKRGDHSICLPEHCESIRPPDPPEPKVQPNQEHLGAAGRKLWADMNASELPALHRTLALEACRITDRLARLDRQLSGEEDWLRFEVNDAEVTVIIDKALSEARQQATALKSIVAELRQSQSIARPGRKPAAAAQGKVKSGGSGDNVVSDLAAFAASRGTPTTG